MKPILNHSLYNLKAHLGFLSLLMILIFFSVAKAETKIHSEPGRNQHFFATKPQCQWLPSGDYSYIPKPPHSRVLGLDGQGLPIYFQTRQNWREDNKIYMRGSENGTKVFFLPDPRNSFVIQNKGELILTGTTKTGMFGIHLDEKNAWGHATQYATYTDDFFLQRDTPDPFNDQIRFSSPSGKWLGAEVNPSSITKDGSTVPRLRLLDAVNFVEKNIEFAPSNVQLEESYALNSNLEKSYLPILAGQIAENGGGSVILNNNQIYQFEPGATKQKGVFFTGMAPDKLISATAIQEGKWVGMNSQGELLFFNSAGVHVNPSIISRALSECLSEIKKTTEFKEIKFAQGFSPTQSQISLTLNPLRDKLAITCGKNLLIFSLPEGQLKKKYRSSDEELFPSLAKFVDPQGRYLHVYSKQGATQDKLFDTENEDSSPMPTPSGFTQFKVHSVHKDGLTLFSHGNLGGLSNEPTHPIIYNYKAVCALPSSERSQILPSEKDVPPCDFTEVYRELKKKDQCPLPEAVAENLLKNVQLGPRNFSLKEAQKLILALQKPGMFNEEEHLNILLTLLESKELRSCSASLFSGVLSNVLAKSPVLYESIIRRTNPHAEMPTQPPQPWEDSPAAQCVAARDQKKIQSAVRKYLQYRIDSLEFPNDVPSPTYVWDWAKFSPLAPILAKLGTPEERETWIEDFAYGLAAGMENDPDLRNIPPGSLAHLATELVGPFFGKPISPKLEGGFSISEEGNRELLLLSSQPFLDTDGKKLSNDLDPKFQFYVLPVEHEELKTSKEGRLHQKVRTHGADYEISLAHDYQNFRQRFEVKPEEVNEVLNRPKNCKFVPEDSHYYQDGVLKSHLEKEPSRKPYIEIVTKSNFEEVCEKMVNRLGEGSCDGIEFSGHSGGCTGSGIFGIRSVNGKEITTAPAEKSRFKRASDCVKKLLLPQTPIIFSSCFSGGNTAEMSELSKILKADVIGPIGLCSSDGWGAYCKNGWQRVKPSSEADIRITQTLK